MVQLGLRRGVGGVVTVDHHPTRMKHARQQLVQVSSLALCIFRGFLSKPPKRTSHCADEYVHRTHSWKGSFTQSTLIATLSASQSKGSDRLSLALATTHTPQVQVDRILLCECDHQADEATGLKTDNSGKFMADIDRVSGREGQK